VTFHPDVALQAMEEVKRRRQERVTAAAEVQLIFTTTSCAHTRVGHSWGAPPAALLRRRAQTRPMGGSMSMVREYEYSK